MTLSGRSRGTLPEDTVSPRHLADPDSQFIQLGGLQVHYKRVGSGEPVLSLLHGLGASLFSWHQVMPTLAQAGSVIAFDRPGFGLTERPLRADWQGDNPYTPQAQADLTVALLDACSAEQAVLVGHSAGGTVAVLTALRYPERVLALVLVAPAIYIGGHPPGWVRLILRLPYIRRLGPLLVRSIRARGERILEHAWHDVSRITPETRAGYLKPFQVTNWDRSLWEVALASRPLGLAKRLDEIRIPVLIITGDDDRVVLTQQSVRLASELPNAQLVVIPACGHIPHEECPQAFLEATLGFLRRIETCSDPE